MYLEQWLALEIESEILNVLILLCSINRQVLLKLAAPISN